MTEVFSKAKSNYCGKNCRALLKIQSSKIFWNIFNSVVEKYDEYIISNID